MIEEDYTYLYEEENKSKQYRARLLRTKQIFYFRYNGRLLECWIGLVARSGYGERVELEPYQPSIC